MCVWVRKGGSIGVIDLVVYVGLIIATDSTVC